MTLGEKIKYLREESRRSQRELAEEVGCSQTMLSSIELNLKKPSYDLLARISAFAKKNKIKIVLL